MSKNRIPRTIFGPKKEDVPGGWRRQHNEEFHKLYASQNIIRVIKSRRMRWAEHVERMGEVRNAYQILVGKIRRTWEENIRRDLKEIGLEGVDWMNLA
jgi:hypothetical protein